MNIEIIRVENGFAVRPLRYYCRNDGRDDTPQMWVYNTYGQLRDDLQRILDTDEPKDRL